MPKDTNYTCSYCEFTSKYKKSVSRHIKTRHEKRKDHKCSICDDTFTSRQGLSYHIKGVHEKVTDIECRYCDMKFSRPHNLSKHVKEVHKRIREYECTLCSIKFSRNETLQRHIGHFHQKDKSNAQENVQDQGELVKKQGVEAKRPVKDESDFIDREHTCQICGSKFKGIEMTRHFMVQCAPSESQISN